MHCNVNIFSCLEQKNYEAAKKLKRSWNSQLNFFLSQTQSRYASLATQKSKSHFFKATTSWKPDVGVLQRMKDRDRFTKYKVSNRVTMHTASNSVKKCDNVLFIFYLIKKGKFCSHNIFFHEFVSFWELIRNCVSSLSCISQNFLFMHKWFSTNSQIKAFFFHKNHIHSN